MKLLSFFMLLTVMLAQDCQNRKNTESLPEMNTTEVLPVIKMMKNPCFGNCPMYSITFHNNGKVDYVGRDHVDKMGTFTKQIPTEKVAMILQQFHSINFWEMEERYLSELSDTQKTIITLFRKDSSKVVTGDHARPAPLKAIEKLMVKIANSKEGWTKTAAHPDERNNLPKSFIKNEIIAKFTKGTDVEAFVKSKEQYGLSIKKRVAPNLDMWVLTYDTMRMNPSIMLIKLKKMPEIEEAEFNKKLTPREH